MLKDDSCYSTSGRYCSAIEFHLSEHQRRAFCTSQLIEYTLEPNPDAADDKDIPPQRLALVFSTADAEVLGWRLRPLVNLVRQGTLASVRSLDTRYSQVNTKQPFIA